jgi:hypothetical protein
LVGSSSDPGTLACRDSGTEMIHSSGEATIPPSSQREAHGCNTRIDRQLDQANCERFGITDKRDNDQLGHRDQ